MTRKIYLIQQNETLQALSEQPYPTEDRLQTLLEQYPDLLAGDQIDAAAPRRWLLVSREVGVPGEEDGANRWSLDHLFLDQEAVPTLVEVKRSSDTRIRREVVGQMLDYAANAVVYWPVEAIRARFEAACEARGDDPAQLVAQLIEADLNDEPALEAFWGGVKTNLQAGRVRLVFVADEIPAELRRIVEFLNEQMDPAQVLAVEVKQYVGQGLRTLVPRVVGQTAGAEKKKSGGRSGRGQWDESTFFQALEAKHSAAEVEVARKILAWARPKTTRIWWGRGIRDGSFVPTLNHNGKDYPLFVVWTLGSIETYFQHYRSRPPFDAEERRLELLERHNEISGISLPTEAINRRPTFSLALLQDEAALQQFLAIYDWVIQEIKAT